MHHISGPCRVFQPGLPSHEPQPYLGQCQVWTSGFCPHPSSSLNVLCSSIFRFKIKPIQIFCSKSARIKEHRVFLSLISVFSQSWQFIRYQSLTIQAVVQSQGYKGELVLKFWKYSFLMFVAISLNFPFGRFRRGLLHWAQCSARHMLGIQ